MAKFKYPLLIAGIFAVALFLRTYFSYHNVFANNWVNYQETDCWFNMRVITDLTQHFPHMFSFDPYGFYPSGMPIYNPPFFYYLFASIAWVIGLGHPTLQTIETVGAYLPAILGALVTIPVFFLGKELFGKTTGLFAALLIALLPGQFLWRGELGFPDYHILEVLLSTTAFMFLVIALKRSGKIMWIFTALAGLFLALYTLTWSGSGIFIAIIFAFIFVQSVINLMRGTSNSQLALMGITIYGIALILDIVWLKAAISQLQSWELVIAILTLVGIWLYSKYAIGLPRLLYPFLAILFGFAIIGLLSIYNPRLFSSIVDQLGILTQSGGMMTIAEVQHSSLSMLWQQFALCFWMAMLALGLLIYDSIKKEVQGRTLLIIWSTIILAATLGQNRFAYYLAIPIALLSAFLAIKLMSLTKQTVTLRKPRRQEIRRKKKKNRKDRKEEKGQFKLAVSPMFILIVLAMLCAIFIPIVPMSIDRVSANTGMSSDWHDAFMWLGNNTQEPLPSYPYYGLQPNKNTYEPSTYGVLSWWDYGYWISYVSHRIPNANPSQMGAKDAGLFFTAGNEAEGNSVLDRLDSKYIIIDNSMATGKFYAMATWAGKSVADFMTLLYYQDDSGMLQPVMLFLPAYYQSMCSRLYNYDGKAVIPSQVLAVWAQPQQVQGNTLMVIKDAKTYTTYSEAQAFVQSNPSYFIAGQNPSQSPVPVEPLEFYSLVYSNSSIKIFEYQGGTL